MYIFIFILHRYGESPLKPMGFCIAFGSPDRPASAVRRAALATFKLAQAVSVGMRHIALVGGVNHPLVQDFHPQ